MSVIKTVDGAAYDEAKGKPGMLFDDMPTIIATVIATADNAFISFYLLAEGMLSARKYDTHGWSAMEWTECE